MLFSLLGRRTKSAREAPWQDNVSAVGVEQVVFENRDHLPTYSPRWHNSTEMVEIIFLSVNIIHNFARLSIGTVTDKPVIDHHVAR